MKVANRVRRVARRSVAAAKSIRDPGPPQAFEPGRFYSPVPDAETLLGAERDRIWPSEVLDPVGVDCAAATQQRVIEVLSAVPTPRWTPSGTAVYDPANDQFPPQDAAVLYAMLRTLRPSRVIEIGCGWSTTVMSQAVRDGDLECDLTCIEPYPRDFLSTIDEIDRMLVAQVEHVPLETFDALGPGDILFIDTSHVVKTGSDVVHLVLEVLPRLRDGVIVHIHDIFIPFDYPIGWVRAGFGWNEQYIVQAFLSGHDRAQMLMMNRWASSRMPERLEAAGIPASEGSSIWFVLGDVPERFEAPAND